MKKLSRFWLFIFLIWIIATAIDRYCWVKFSGIPAWDQADYLNSALEHGRALGLLAGGEWTGFQDLLDLSPKIPPLASLINGSIMALVGEDPAKAAWSLSIWHGLLLFSVAKLGVALNSKNFSILSVCFVAISPALIQLRTDYVLEMPLTASLTLTLWLIGSWLHPKTGGKIWQAILAACATAFSLLIKQSSLLIIFPALIYTIVIILKERREKTYQLIGGLGIVFMAILPWLKHNWITFIGGTNRAVIESASIEGDPSLLTLDNWTWYPKILPDQIGITILIFGLSGIILWVFLLLRGRKNSFIEKKSNDDIFLWKWLLINFLSSWILTTLTPNKDERYIAPLLPQLIILLSRGWWELNIWIKKINPYVPTFNNILISISVGYLGTIPQALSSQINFFNNLPKGPIKSIVKSAGGANINQPKKTLIVIPSTPDLNQHNVSFFGRLRGGELVGRQLGTNQNELLPLMNQAEWIVLAEGNQGSVRESAILFDQAIRDSNIFTETKRFKRVNGGSYSLWQRNKTAQKPTDFAKIFPKLARRMELGPKGLEIIFKEIAIQHMLDGHFKYRTPVANKALKKIKIDPKDIDSYWTLTLLSILENRPSEASLYLKKLQLLIPENSWPSTYRSIVELAQWNPWKAEEIANMAKQNYDHTILEALGDLSGIIRGAVWKIQAAQESIPKAIAEINQDLENK